MSSLIQICTIASFSYVLWHHLCLIQITIIDISIHGDFMTNIHAQNYHSENINFPPNIECVLLPVLVSNHHWHQNIRC